MKSVKKASLMVKIGDVFSNIAQRYVPDASIFAIALTLIIFSIGLIMGSTPKEMTEFFGNSMWALLSFTTQILLTLVFSTVLANTKSVSRLLDKLTSIPKNSKQAIMLGVFLSMIACTISWALGLVFGAVYAKNVVKKVENIDYPLLVASCYTCIMVWHGGLSGTIPLTAATPGSFIEPIIGRIISVGDTLFSSLNILLIIIFITTIPFIMRSMIPSDENVKTIDPSIIKEEKIDYQAPDNPTPAQKLEYSRIPTILFGILIMGYLFFYFSKTGFIKGLNLNSLNLILLTLVMFNVSNVIELGKRFVLASQGAGGIFFQFPIYAGIMGMANGSGLASLLSEWFTSFATTNTLPNILYISSAFLNLLIPSGGGKFAIEAPVYLPAAMELGADIPKVLLACSWGDALTNLIQPFWAIPMLAIAKLSIRDIMGYCAIICIYGFIVTQIVLTIF